MRYTGPVKIVMGGSSLGFEPVRDFSVLGLTFIEWSVGIGGSWVLSRVRVVVMLGQFLV
jgi:hypothetical protein